MSGRLPSRQITDFLKKANRATEFVARPANVATSVLVGKRSAETVFDIFREQSKRLVLVEADVRPLKTKCTMQTGISRALSNAFALRYILFTVLPCKENNIFSSYCITIELPSYLCMCNL